MSPSGVSVEDTGIAGYSLIPLADSSDAPSLVIGTANEHAVGLYVPAKPSWAGQFISPIPAGNWVRLLWRRGRRLRKRRSGTGHVRGRRRLAVAFLADQSSSGAWSSTELSGNAGSRTQRRCSWIRSDAAHIVYVIVGNRHDGGGSTGASSPTTLRTIR